MGRPRYSSNTNACMCVWRHANVCVRVYVALSVLLPPASPRPRAPSWVAELEDDPDLILAAQVRDPVLKWMCMNVHIQSFFVIICICLNYQDDNQQTLKGLRLQFAEQISLLVAERKSSDLVEKLFRGTQNTNRWCQNRLHSSKCYPILKMSPLFVSHFLSDNKIESLIQKADQVLNSLSQSCAEADCPANPANTGTQLKTQGFSLLSSVIESFPAVGVFSSCFDLRQTVNTQIVILLLELTFCSSKLSSNIVWIWGSKETSLFGFTTLF